MSAVDPIACAIRVLTYACKLKYTPYISLLEIVGVYAYNFRATLVFIHKDLACDCPQQRDCPIHLTSSKSETTSTNQTFKIFCSMQLLLQLQVLILRPAPRMCALLG